MSSTPEPAADSRSKERRYKPDETRDRVLAAARLLFRTKGYLSTSTSDLAAEAGVAEGSIFYHFGTKRNLLAVMGREFAHEMVSAMRGDADDLRDLEPGIMIDRVFDFCLTKGAIEDVIGLTHDDPQSQPYFAASREVMVDFIESVMAARKDALLARGVNIPIAASLSYAAVHDALDRVMCGDQGFDFETVKQECIRFVRAASGYKSES